MTGEAVQLRAVARAFGEMVLDWLKAIAQPYGGEFEPALVLIAIQQANQPAGWDGPPRLISTTAVAQSLGFSRETTRRYVLTLEARGEVRRTDAGLLAAVDEALDARRTLYGIIRRFIERLRNAGVDFALPDGPDLPPPGVAPLESDLLGLVGRTHDRFIMRWIESSIRDFESDLRLMLVHTALLTENERPVLEDARLNTFYGAMTSPPEVLRRPAPIATLAGRVGMPRETTRRYVVRLESRGWLTRKPEGFLTLLEGPHLDLLVRRLVDLYPNIRQFVLILRAGGATFTDQRLS